MDFANAKDSPSFEFWTTRKRQIRKNLSPEEARGVLKFNRVERSQIARRHCLDSPGVNDDHFAVKTYRMSVGYQGITSVNVHDLANLGQTPPQCATAVVGSVPKHLTEAFPMRRTICDGKVGKQGPGLARR